MKKIKKNGEKNKKNTKLKFEQFCDIIRNNTCLQNDEDSDSNDSGDTDILKKLPKDKVFSSKDIIGKIKNEKCFYNMTEGDDIKENSHKFSGFHRTKTTIA